MRKNLVIALILMVFCVSTSKAQSIFGIPGVYVVSVSSDNITFMGGMQVPTESVPFGAFLTNNTWLPKAVYEAVKARKAYWGHDWAGFANEIAFEKAKLAGLKALLNGKNSSRANRGTRTVSRTSNGSRGQKSDSTRITEIKVDSNGVTLITDGGDYDFSE